MRERTNPPALGRKSHEVECIHPEEKVQAIPIRSDKVEADIPVP